MKKEEIKKKKGYRVETHSEYPIWMNGISSFTYSE